MRWTWIQFWKCNREILCNCDFIRIKLITAWANDYAQPAKNPLRIEPVFCSPISRHFWTMHNCTCTLIAIRMKCFVRQLYIQIDLSDSKTVAIQHFAISHSAIKRLPIFAACTFLIAQNPKPFRVLSASSMVCIYSPLPIPTRNSFLKLKFNLHRSFQTIHCKRQFTGKCNKTNRNGILKVMRNFITNCCQIIFFHC